MNGGGLVRTLRRTALGIVGTALLLGTVNLATGLKHYSDDADAAQRPFAVSATMAQAARGRTFVATAQGVRGAAVISDSADHTTPGVWLIVKVRVMALDKPMFVGYAALRDARGRVFVASNRVEHQVVGYFGRQLQPGLPVVGEIAFEIPRDGATGATLLLAGSSDLRMDSMLEITLSTASAATVDDWATDTEPTTLITPAVVA
jgi:hypothetical protein